MVNFRTSHENLLLSLLHFRLVINYKGNTLKKNKKGKENKKISRAIRIVFVTRVSIASCTRSRDRECLIRLNHRDKKSLAPFGHKYLYIVENLCKSIYLEISKKKKNLTFRENNAIDVHGI